MRFAALTISFGLFVAGIAHAQLPTYASIHRLGLDSSEHTNINGAQQSQATRYYPSLEWIGGTSTRYSGGVAAGQSAWIWSATIGTVRVGLIDPEHTRADGLRNSNILFMSHDGFMAGWSDRYIGATAGGRSAWTSFADRGTIRLGFSDAAHTRSDGYQNSEPRFVNSAGTVVGWSDRFVGAGAGRSVWVSSRALDLMRLGLTDALHTATDGTQRSDTSGMNSLGRVIGTSTRFQGAPGTTAWAWSPESGYTTLGYIGAQHTSSTGTQSSSAIAINDAGRIIGSSSAYSGTTFLGSWGWTWTDALGLTRIGLFDAEHTSSGGNQSTTVTSLLPSGRIVGWSTRYPGGGSGLGSSAWTWTPTSGTVRMGLIDAEHVRSTDGEAISIASTPHSDPVLFGWSARYVGTCSCGQSGWIWSEAGGSVRVGLVDAVHTRANGHKNTVVTSVNHLGQAVGFSDRFSGSTTIGATGWIFEPASGTQAIPAFSLAPTGAWTTQPSLITESGIVFGTFNLYSGSSGSFVQHAFAWSPQMGLVNLGTVVPGGLGASGWTGLTSVVQSRGVVRILGAGIRDTAMKVAPYVLAAPLCAADFDDSGVVTELDVLGFIVAWFSGESRADIDHVGGVQVQDIFVFLSAWFAGC